MATSKANSETQPTQTTNNDCFIIMPIADHPDYKSGHFKRVYEDILAPACQAAGYKPVRADDVTQANLIHLDILQKLLESPMAICDLSTRNPNVLFELGLRQAFDKPTILVQEVGTPKIFDINMFRYTEYRNGLDYRDVLSDQKAIQKVLEETRTAVNEGKSVNSIIKLLSITAPASLQDSSNFEDKEYFNVLMSEIGSLKNAIYSNKQPLFNRSLKQQEPPLNKKTFHYGIYFKKDTSLKEIDFFMKILEQAYDIQSLKLHSVNPHNTSFASSWLSIYFSNEISENELIEFANINNIGISSIDDFPF